MSASENQQGGLYIQNFIEFRDRLASLGFWHLNIILPMAYLDISFLDHCLLCDDAMENLERRIHLWEEGNISELLAECVTIQEQLTNSHKAPDDSTLAKRFASMVFNNNLKGAMSLVCQKGKGGVLSLDDTTKTEMKAKHPKSAYQPKFSYQAPSPLKSIPSSLLHSMVSSSKNVHSKPEEAQESLSKRMSCGTR